MSQVKYSLGNFKSSPHYFLKILQEEGPEEKDKQVQETRLFQAVYSVEKKPEIQVLKYLKDNCKMEEEVTENIWIGQEKMSLRQTTFLYSAFRSLNMSQLNTRIDCINYFVQKADLDFAFPFGNICLALLVNSIFCCRVGSGLADLFKSFTDCFS